MTTSYPRGATSSYLRHPRLAPLLCAILLAFSARASALGLGEITIDSAVGEPLRGELELRLADGEAIRSECFTLARNPGADLPWLADANLNVIAQGGRWGLRIATREPVFDPAFVIGLRVGCGFGLAREFTVLLSAPPESAPPPSPDLAREALPSHLWETIEGESLRSIAAALYPDNSKMRRRFIRAALEANTNVATDPDMALPQGTKLRIPDLRTLAGRQPLRAPSQPIAAGKEEVRPTKQLRHEAASKPATAKTFARAGKRDVLAVAPAPEEVVAALEAADARRRAGAAEIPVETSPGRVGSAPEAALLARIGEMETTVARLRAQIAQLDAQIEQATAPAAIAARQREQVMVAGSKPAVAPQQPVPDWLIGMIAGLGVAGVAFGLHRIQGRRRQFPTEQPETSEGEPQDITHSGTLPKPLQPSMEVSEHDSAVELADILLASGRTEGAARILAEIIKANPKGGVQPWLKLLEIHRRSGMRQEFEALAEQLNRHYNVRVLQWTEPGREEQAPQAGIDTYPHITERIADLWPTEECRRFLERLVADNRGGLRQGFSEAALQDILFLSALLQERSRAAWRSQSTA